MTRAASRCARPLVRSRPVEALLPAPPRTHRRTALGLVLAVLLALLATVAGAALAQTPQERLEQAERRAEQAAAELAQLGAEATAVAGELADLRRQVDDERARLRALEGRLALAADELDARREDLAAAEADEQGARGAFVAAEDELAQGTRILEDRLATTWMLGGDPGPAMLAGILTSAETPSDVAIGLHLLQVATSHQVGIVDDVTQLRERTAVLAGEARAARRAAEDARTEADEAVEFARRTRDEQAAVTARLEEAEARQESILAGLQGDREQARVVLAAVEADVEQAEAAAAAAVGGPVVAGATCPVVGAVAGRDFSNDWGDPRSGGRNHEGTDVFGDRGTPVVSLADGTVRALRRTDTGLGGLYVSIWVGPRQHWYYAHLDEVVPGLSEGDRVAEGQQIGTVGDSGNARGTPPHLHIGYYDDDVAVNPYPVLADRCR